MRRAGLSALLLAGLVAFTSPAFAQAPAAKPAAEAKRLHALFAKQWAWRLEQYPTFATYVGEKGYNHRLPDLSGQAIDRRKADQRAFLAQASAIDPAKLSPQDRLNHELFVYELKEDVAADQFPNELLAIQQMGGAHDALADLAQVAPKQTVADLEAFLARMRAYPAMVDQTVALLRRGLEAKVTPPRIILTQVESLMGRQLPTSPEQSPVYELAFAKMPDAVPSAEQERLRREALAVLTNQVLPAIARLKKFWVEEYFPKTREDTAFNALPNGDSWYRQRIREHTTTALTADEIHALGLTEVKRIRAQMEDILRETGFKGGLQEFFKFLRTDPRFFHADKESLLAGYRDIAKRVDPELTKLFGRLPRLPYGVTAVPSYSEKVQTTAYYMPGSLEAGRAGMFYANTYDLKSRPKWEMEALTLHEAVPGHHLQIALAQELEGMPKFRRYAPYNAFVEGWGLYGESLGRELGLLKDPYSRFGGLAYEMWRAVRLVVDTGMHAKGWTRDRAIAFFHENAPKTEHDIRVEVDRYLAWPGQALAYKVGELKFKELRALASRELGERFDIRAFHDHVLGAGAVPLDILERRVRAWIDEHKRAVPGKAGRDSAQGATRGSP